MTHPSRIKAVPATRLTRAVPILLPIALVSASSAWWGCSAATDTQVFEETTATTTATTTTGVGGAGGSMTGTGGDVMFDAGTMDAPINDAGACVASEAQAQLIPLDMIILLDRSGSMVGQKWDGSTNALKTFVNDPASSGINVGIVYYPIDNAAESCDYLLYSDLAVPVAELPGNAPALVASIDAEDPNGSDTPTYGALKGALFNATGYQEANPTHKVIVVFASDGDPNGCPDNQDNISEIAGLASSALNYNGVQTYVIAIQGATVGALNQIAAAGGTMQAYDVTANVAQFSQKMAEIRAAALSCEFVIPPPPAAQELDPEKINVSYTPGGQGMPQTLPQAQNLADCGAGAGWYYDNNMEPTKILLCPGSCTTVQADSAAAIGVLFGCKTEVN